MGIAHELHDNGIGFVKGGQLIPFSIDSENPKKPASHYFLTKQKLGLLFSAWKQWQKFATKVLSTEKGRDFFSQFLTKGSSSFWDDYERSEFGYYEHTRNYFQGPHVTRIDFALDFHQCLRIMDPNIMPYGMAQVIPAQNLLDMATHLPYVEELKKGNFTWVCDPAHGNAVSVRIFCESNGINFVYSDEFEGAENVIRQTRKPIFGENLTINAPGMRVFETQIWAAFMSVPGIGESFGFNVDINLHRANVVPTYLCQKTETGEIKVAIAYSEGLVWIPFSNFEATQWTANLNTVFLKNVFTSGCHQVTWSEFKHGKIQKAVVGKLNNPKFFLLQPAMNCTVNDERVRIASYLGADGTHYASEVTRVPANCMLAHSGEHAKESYLYF